jgi:hypothetical protein
MPMLRILFSSPEDFEVVKLADAFESCFYWFLGYRSRTLFLQSYPSRCTLISNIQSAVDYLEEANSNIQKEG